MILVIIYHSVVSIVFEPWTSALIDCFVSECHDVSIHIYGSYIWTSVVEVFGTRFIRCLGRWFLYQLCKTIVTICAGLIEFRTQIWKRLHRYQLIFCIFRIGGFENCWSGLLNCLSFGSSKAVISRSALKVQGFGENSAADSRRISVVDPVSTDVFLLK